LRQKIDGRLAIVGVVGLGYVGLPLLHTFHKGGFPVIGYDIDGAKVEAIRNGVAYIKHIGPEI